MYNQWERVASLTWDLNLLVWFLTYYRMKAVLNSVASISAPANNLQIVEPITVGKNQRETCDHNRVY